jgi:hypothetical protein
LSGRQDSNLRPPGPKPGAMTGLRYAPNYYFKELQSGCKCSIIFNSANKIFK